MSAVLQEKDLILSQFQKFVPQISPFFSRPDSLAEYSKSLYNFQIHPSHATRLELIRTKLREKLLKLYGDNALESLNVNLNKISALNIVDHHQVLNHPLLIGSNIISSADKFLNSTKAEATIVISSGDVPPNNYFSKNGFQFHGRRVPLFSVGEKDMTSFYIPKRDFDFVERLKKADRWKGFNDQEKSFLTTWRDQLGSLDYSQCSNYLDQITEVVRFSWPFMFEEKLRNNLPELIYITQEELVSECLKDILKSDNLISQTILDPVFRAKVLQNFRGIVVTWNETENKGTHFFWRKHPTKNESLRLYIKDGLLMPADPQFANLSISMNSESLLELLEKREIYPSLFLIFSVLNFYSGIKPLCGYGSVAYLDYMKKSWIKTLQEVGAADEANFMSLVDTNGFVGGSPIFFKKEEGKPKTLYAHDIFYDGGIKEEYLQTIFNKKISDLLSVAVADMYDYYASKYIPESERIKPNINFDDLAALSFDWI